MLRLSLLLFILHFSLLLHSQCELKLDNISWDSTALDPRDFKLSFSAENGSDILSPISKSQNKIEVRIVRLIQTRRFWLNNCIRIYCDMGENWKAEQFVSIPADGQDSLFSSEAKMKWEKVGSFERTPLRFLKYQFILPPEKEEFWLNFSKAFNTHQFLNLKNEEEVYEQLLTDAISEFGHIDSIPIAHRLNLLPTNGVIFRLELKYLNSFKRLEYYAADFYTDIFPDVPEFRKMLELFELMDTTFGFLKNR
ncbi:MAG: hypothetical protein AAGD28_23725 [Bacteroidota bacterium]